MRICRIAIENFRNFRNFTVDLDDHAVIVGENKVGKSNLLFALRLILDPSLPDSLRRLKREDFWDGLEEPFTASAVISVSVDLTDFEDDVNLMAVLAEHLVEPEPMVSRLTYEFRPMSGLSGPPQKDSDYEFLVFGGDRPENLLGYEVRSRLPMDLLQALRDAEGDLASWRRSPLRPLLDKAVSSIPEQQLKDICCEVEEAISQIHGVEHIKTLSAAIVRRLLEMVGSTHAVETELRLSTTDPVRLFRSLRLLLDGCKRGIGEASLGTANLIYLALKSLELEQLVEDDSRDHSFLAIEEPEAHLHPHLQRLIYRDFLHPREHLDSASKESISNTKPKTTVLLTTHSPHIASVAPLRSFVLLKHSSEERCTRGFSTARTPFDDADVKDIERYLDVTRGEMLFARGILLVEGDAELYLVPRLAMLQGQDLDRLGITVCSVSGTNFLPYIKLLGPQGLSIPHAVITDYDPVSQVKDDGTEVVTYLGPNRLKQMLETILTPIEYKAIDDSTLLQASESSGLFINTHTFEVSLFEGGHHIAMCTALKSLSSNKKLAARADALIAAPESFNAEAFLKDIETVSKGRFGQRLASEISSGEAPSYIKKAIDYVVERCR